MTENNLILRRINGDVNNYTASLMDIFPEKFTPEVRSRIMSQLGALFCETADRYVMRASSSVSDEEAERIMSSLMFKSDVFLLAMRSDMLAAQTLLSADFAEICENGGKAILEYYNELKSVYRVLKKNSVMLPVYFYRHTSEDCFREFMRLYDAKYSAHLIPTMIDYPLLFEPACQKGILYIREYYTSLKLENDYCNLFEFKELRTLFTLLSRQYHCHCSDLYTNICETVLWQSVCAVLADKPVFTLYMNKADADGLIRKLAPFGLEQYRSFIRDAMGKISLSISNPAVVAYVRRYTDTMALSLFERVKNNSLPIVIFE